MKTIKRKFRYYVVELRNFQEVKGNNLSIPYQAELWVNNKKIASCFNDGNGKATIITPIDFDLFNKVAKDVCSTRIKENDNIPYSMVQLSDILAYDYIEAKSVEEKQVNGLMLKSKSGLIYMIPFKDKDRKSVPIAELLLSDNGKNLIRKTIKKYEKKGYTVLNDNLKINKRTVI